ncbi:hypothetical protein [Chryseobacterium sp. G0201]|uniref:hypothetical protein n=1 Tax=Chryseobacterium sp. G0201 TaxID=2487065 RepID=UPI000F4DF139|nr:hypothetical protein [Chryseobacterium sp. G0201]AZA51642.1 hypothetical protein EG348_00755 [Chryseobacterium sp. G0201]
MTKNILLILLSAFALFFSIKEFGYFFISIPSFMLLSYNLSDLIVKTSKKSSNKTDIKNFDYIFLFAMIPFLIFGRYFENTIGGYELFWKLTFISLIFSGLTTFILTFFYSFNNDKKKNNILSLCIFFFLLIPSLGIFINYRFSISDDRRERIEINKKYINNGSRSKSYEIFIRTKFDKNERLSISEEFYESISNNQLIELTLSKGVLGYDYVEKIKRVSIYR